MVGRGRLCEPDDQKPTGNEESGIRKWARKGTMEGEEWLGVD